MIVVYGSEQRELILKRLEDILEKVEEPVHISDLMKTKHFQGSARCINPSCFSRILKSDSEVYEIYPHEQMSKIVICRKCAIPFLIQLRDLPVIDRKCYLHVFEKEHQTYKPINLEIK